MIEIGARGRGQHDARAVVVGKHHVALDRAGGEDHPLGADLPEPLARQLLVGLGEMVGDALGEADEILGVVAERGRAGQNRDIRASRPACAAVACAQA